MINNDNLKKRKKIQSNFCKNVARWNKLPKNCLEWLFAKIKKNCKISERFVWKHKLQNCMKIWDAVTICKKCPEGQFAKKDDLKGTLQKWWWERKKWSREKKSYLPTGLAERKKSHLPTGLAGPPPFWIGPGLATGGGGFLFFSSSYLRCDFIKEALGILRKLFEYKPDSLSLTSCLLLFFVLIHFLCSLCISLNTRSWASCYHSRIKTFRMW